MNNLQNKLGISYVPMYMYISKWGNIFKITHEILCKDWNCEVPEIDATEMLTEQCSIWRWYNLFIL